MPARSPQYMPARLLSFILPLAAGARSDCPLWCNKWTLNLPACTDCDGSTCDGKGCGAASGGDSTADKVDGASAEETMAVAVVEPAPHPQPTATAPAETLEDVGPCEVWCNRWADQPECRGCDCSDGAGYSCVKRKPRPPPEPRPDAALVAAEAEAARKANKGRMHYEPEHVPSFGAKPSVGVTGGVLLSVECS